MPHTHAEPVKKYDLGKLLHNLLLVCTSVCGLDTDCGRLMLSSGFLPKELELYQISDIDGSLWTSA